MTELLFEKVRNEILLPKLHGGPDQDALDALRSLEEQLEAAQRTIADLEQQVYELDNLRR